MQGDSNRGIGVAGIDIGQDFDQFTPNAARADTWINGDENATYQPRTPPGGTVPAPVPSIPRFLAKKNTEINNAADGILAQSRAARDAAAQSANNAKTSETNAAASAASSDAQKLRTDLASNDPARGAALIAYDPSNTGNPIDLATRAKKDVLRAFDCATALERIDLVLLSPQRDHTALMRRVIAQAQAEDCDIDWSVRGRVGKARYLCNTSVNGRVDFIGDRTRHTGPAVFLCTSADASGKAVEVLTGFAISRDLQYFDRIGFWAGTSRADRRAVHPVVIHGPTHFRLCDAFYGLSDGFQLAAYGANFDAYYAQAGFTNTPASLGTNINGCVFEQCRGQANGDAWRSTNAVAWNDKAVFLFTKDSTNVTFDPSSPVTPDLTTMLKPGDCLFQPGGLDLSGEQRPYAPYYGIVTGLVVAVTASTITLANPWGKFNGAPANRAAAIAGVGIGHAAPGFDYLNNGNWQALTGGLTVSGAQGSTTVTFSAPVPLAARRFWRGGTPIRIFGDLYRMLGVTSGSDDTARWNADFTQLTLIEPLKRSIPAGTNWAVYHGEGINSPRNGDSGRGQIIGGTYGGNGGGAWGVKSLYGWYIQGGVYQSLGFGWGLGLSGGKVIINGLYNLYCENMGCGSSGLVGAASLSRDGFVSGEVDRRMNYFNSGAASAFSTLEGVAQTTTNVFGEIDADNSAGLLPTRMWRAASGRVHVGLMTDDGVGVVMTPPQIVVQIPAIAPGQAYRFDTGFTVGVGFSTAVQAAVDAWRCVPGITKPAVDSGPVLSAETENPRRSGNQLLIGGRVFNPSTSQTSTACTLTLSFFNSR